MNEKQKTILFWVITVLLPILLFFLIELAFIISGYEKDKQELFVEAPKTPSHLIANAKFVPRYFPGFVPEVAPNAFRKVKAENTFRVFTFGGSSIEGFPYNFYYSFPELLEQKLLLNTQGLRVEVINLGMTAVNSYVIRDLSKRVLEYQPDAIIIYAGHNEYYGSFGAATTQFGFTNSVKLKRLIIWLKNFRSYQFLEGLLNGGSEGNGEQRTMMAKVIRSSDIPLDSPTYTDGLVQFKENMDDVIEWFGKQEIPVYIGSLASNLKDQTPLSDDESLANSYQNARDLLANGQKQESLALFEEVKELDGTRFRAPEDINNIIKELSSNEHVTLVDVQQLMRRSSSSGIEDESLFIDHLHPNEQAHRIIAQEFYEAIKQEPLIAQHLLENPIDIPTSASRFEQAYANISIARLLEGYPFVKNRSVEEELAAFNQKYNRYLEANYIDSIAAVASRNQVFVPLALTETLANARSKKDTMEAVALSYDLLKWQLNSTNLIESSIELTLGSKAKEPYLINLLHQVINDGNEDPRYIELLSSLYLVDNNTRQASYWLELNESLTPNAPRLLYNYSRYHLLEGDTLKAAEYYQRFLATQRNP
jgi:lysophospholipase L1-like esterase